MRALSHERLHRHPPRALRPTLEAFTLHFGLHGFFETVALPSALIFTAFVLDLGIQKEKMGFLASAVSFATLAQLLSVPLFRRVHNRRRAILLLGAAEPLVLAAALVALPFLPPDWRLLTVAVAAVLAATVLNLMWPAKEEWTTICIPAPLRGRYIGIRWRVYGVASLLALLASGQIAERFAGAGTVVLALLLAAGCLAGLASVVILLRTRVPPPETPRAAAVRPWAAMARNAPYLRWILGVVIFSIPFSLAVPYYQVFYLEGLHLPRDVISYMLTGYWLLRVFAAPALGKMVERVGARAVCVACGASYVVFFGLLVATGGGNPWLLAVAWTLAAISDSSNNIGMTSALYGTVERSDGKPAYFAVASVVTTLLNSLGALAAVALVTALRDTTLVVGPLVLGQFHLLYAICLVLTMFCTFGGLLLPGRRGGVPSLKETR